MPRTFSARSAAKRLMTRRPLAVESLEAREVPAAYTWLPTAPGAYSWNDPANWNGNEPAGFPNAAGDVADITSAAAGNQVINLSTPTTVGTLSVGSAGGSGAFTIVGNGNTLTFQDASGGAALTATGASDGDAVLASVAFATPLTVTNNAAAALSLFGSVTGAGPLTVAGTGPVALPNGASLPAAVTLAGTGTITNPTALYATSFFDGGLYAFDSGSGATLATFAAPYAASSPLSGPAGMTIGPDGGLYVSSQSNNTVLRYDPRTGSVTTFVSADQLDAARTGTGNTNAVFAPSGLAFGPTDGDLYVVLNGGRNSFGDGAVIRFDVSGGAYAGTFTKVAGDAFTYQPSSLTFGPGADATSLYLTSAVPVLAGGQVVGFNGRITRVANADTTPTSSELITPGAGGLSFPAGLAFGSDGRLYVADLAALEEFIPAPQGRVVRFDANGANPVDFTPPAGSPGSLSLQFPSGILFDPAGRLLTGNLGPTRPPATNGSVNRYLSTGGFDRVLVSSAQFPNTGTTGGGVQTSGVTTSQIALGTNAGLTVAGTLAPSGTGPGVLTAGDVRFGSNATVAVTLNGPAAGTGYDQLAATGVVNLAGAALTGTAGFTPAGGSTFTVVTAKALTGTFDGLAEGATATFGGQAFRVNYTPTAVTLTALAGPAFTSANAATFFTGSPNTLTLTATGTPAPTFAVTAGSLPAGVTLSAAGVLSGTPTQTGDFPVTVTATNSVGTATQNFTLTVATSAAPAITSPNAASFLAGTGGTFTVVATGGPPPTLTQTGALPAGVTFNPTTGVLTVAPTAASGTSNLTFTATNASGIASQNFALTVGTVPAITSGPATTFFSGAPGTFTVTASGSPTPTLTQTGTLPAGVTFDAATGVLSGTPTQSGDFPLTFTATNGFGTGTQTFTLTVQAGAVPAFTSANTASFVAGTGGTFAVTTTGNPTSTLTQTGTLPAGVTFNPATGVLTVAPTAAAGSTTLTFTAANVVGSTPQTFTLNVTAAGTAPAFTSGPTATFAPGVAGAFTVTAGGSPSPTFAVTGGTLPAGVTLSPAGLLSGTTSQLGSFPVTITATNASGTATQNFTLTVTATPTFSSPTTTTFTAGSANTFAVRATGSPTPTLSVAGTLPAGVTFNPTTGVLSGTPTQAGTFQVTFTATNGSPTSASQAFTLQVNAPPAITSANAASFVAGTGGTFTVVATGTPAATLAQTGTLPTGVTFNPTTGVLTVAPTAAAGTTNLTFTATNGIGTDAAQAFTLTITPAPVTPSALSPRLVASGPTNGAALVFDPTAAGSYPAAATASVSPFGAITTSVRTAVADVNADGFDDIIAVTGPGVPIRVAVVSGADNQTLLVQPFDPFGGDFTGGGFAAAADLDGDGRAEFAVTPDQGGGPRVTAFSLVGTTATQRANFFGIDDVNFRGGARAAFGDVDADGTPDLAVAAGFLGGPRVAVYDGSTLTGTPVKLVNDFFAFPGQDAVNLRNGAFVALGDVDADGFADLIFGGGPGGGPRVFVLSGRTVAGGDVAAAQASSVANFFVAGNSTDRGGVRVGTVDADGDGRADVVVGSGDGLPSRVRVYLGSAFTTTSEPTAQDLDPFAQTLPGGVYVG